MSWPCPNRTASWPLTDNSVPADYHVTMTIPHPVSPTVPPLRTSRRALLLAAPAVLVGHRLATRAQDQQASPSLAATPSASPAADACPAAGPCPVGCWVVSDIGPFIESGLMDVTGVRDLAYRSADGSLRFTFSPDGAVRIVADVYRVAVSAKLRLLGEVDTAVSFDGELVGRYTLAGETLTIADVTRQDLVITADTPVGDIGIDNDDVFAGGTSRLVCDPDPGGNPAADTLRLYPAPTNDTAIVLSRTVAIT